MSIIYPIHNAPYTNFHDLNLDWIIDALNDFDDRLSNFVSLATIKYANPIQWDITRQYEANTVVVDSAGNAYLSVQPVPSGVSLDRTEYWTKIGNFDELFADVKKAITPNDEGHSTTATAARAVNDLVWVNGALVRVTRAMIAGDAYVPGSNCVTSSTNEVVHYLLTALNAEQQAREDADTQLDQKITNEQTARQNADTQLSQQISNETTELSQQISNETTELSQQISNETTAREQADTQLSQKIENLKTVSVKTVKDYGAKGDGTTNDTAAFTSALSETGVAIVPPGTYLVGTLPMSSGQKILGLSRYKSILKYQGNGAIISISGANCEVSAMTLNGNSKASDGIINNGYKDCYLHDIDILDCSQNGINLSPTSTETATTGVSHLENIRSYFNGKYGILIDHVADVCLIAVECVSNSQQADNVYSNLAIRGCAVKCVNSHFWNVNDSFGYKRPKTSVDISGGANDNEFTNCHIEGGRDSNLAIGSDCARNRFINCMIYASFGSVSVWNAGWQSSFIGCTFTGQAGDNVTKPAWNAVFSAGGQITRMMCENCVFNTKIASNPVYSSVISGFIDGTLAEYLPTKSDCLVSVINGSGTVETLGY